MNIAGINLKVLVMDTDFYALQAINSYLAWDRRTRVIDLCESIDAMWSVIQRAPLAEQPDVILLDSDHIGGAAALRVTIDRLRQLIPDVIVICLAQFPDPMLIEAAALAKARGFFLKGDVRLQIAWAVVFALEHEFVVSIHVARAAERILSSSTVRVTSLPRRREYPELTERIRQAIELCVVKGMPAHLAADEMGISLHTIRSYIKEGYRILEAYDETEYPVDMSPQERAFMRLTRFTDEEDV